MESLARLVVQMDVRGGYSVGEGREIDAKTMILRGDLNPPCGEIHDRLIGAAMTKL